MGFVIDVLSFVVFPGIIFSVLAGIITSWLAAWLTALLRREPDPGLAARIGDLGVLASTTVTSVELRPRWSVSVLLLGLGAAAAASSYLWRAALAPGTSHLGTLTVYLSLLFTPVLAGVAVSDWLARSKGVGRARDGLVLAYAVVLLLALLVPMIVVRSTAVGSIVAGQVATGPLLATSAGALGVLVAVLATRGVVTLVGTLYDEGMRLLPGATEALLLQMLRGVFLYLLVSSIVVLYWANDSSAQGGLLYVAKYLLVLLVLVLLREGAARLQSGRLLGFAWVPLLALAAGALALAVGGV